MVHTKYKTINIGIFAHVDAGKTTITENLLYQSGVLKEVGRVDKGNTQTDSMIQERERGISIQSAPISFTIDDLKVNLIDTPGHVDFVAEVERTINILDGAILVLSAKEGVQPHTHLLFKSLRELGIPVIFFVNKIDRAGCDIEQVINDIRAELTADIIPVQKCFDSGTREASVSDIFQLPLEESSEFLADRDEELLLKILNDESVSRADLEAVLINFSRTARIYPLLFGSALVGTGMEELSRSIGMFFPAGQSDNCESAEPSWQVFKITRSPEKTRLTYVRVFRGSINLWDNYGSHKVTKILRLHKGKTESVTSLPAGEIGIIQGLTDLKVNDSFGPMSGRISVSLGKPTLRYAVKPASPTDKSKLIKGVSLIAEGDPYLEYELDDARGEIFINLFGEIQMEILKDLLLRDHSVEINFLKPEIICREAVKAEAESVLAMSDKENPYNATIGIRVEPNQPGSGNEIRSEVSEGDLPGGLLRGAIDGISGSLRQGLKGWEVTDTLITVTESGFVPVTTPADFRNLAPMVLFEALDKADTAIYWPLLSFDINISEKFYGKVMEDLIRMGSRDIEIAEKNNGFSMKGIVPAELFQDYPKKFAAYAGGNFSLSSAFKSFEKAPKDFSRTGRKIYADPLNKFEYIMSKKGIPVRK